MFTSDFEGFCCLEEGGQLVLADVDFATIHVIDKGSQVCECDIFEEHYCLLVRLLTDQILEKSKI